jgi:transcriptional regulator with XRE-family HTH domain
MHPLRRARLENGFSVRRLAEAANVSDAVIVRAENGTPISDVSAFKIATTLGADPDVFVPLLHDLEPASQGTPADQRTLA